MSTKFCLAFAALTVSSLPSGALAQRPVPTATALATPSAVVTDVATAKKGWTTSSATMTTRRGYAEAGYTAAEAEAEVGGFGADISVGNFTGRAGLRANKYFALEIEGQTTINKQEVETPSFDADASINYLVGAFVRGEVPVTPKVSVHARIGVITAEADLDVSGTGAPIASGTDDEDGYAYGIGISAKITERVYVRGDYTRYEFDTNDAIDLDIDAVSVTVGTDV